MRNITTKYSSTQGGAVSRPGGGGENKDDVMGINSCGSSMVGSAALDVDGASVDGSAAMDGDGASSRGSRMTSPG